MAKKSKDPSDPIPTFIELHKEWIDESPRGVVLTAAAYLDDRLAEMIRAFFLENEGAEKLLSGFNAPLGTFSSRIAGASALGLLTDKEFKQLNLIREVRNEFAHKIIVKFTDSRVASLVTKFISVSFGFEWKPRPKKELEDLMINFRAKVFELIIEFMQRPAKVKRQRLIEFDWYKKNDED